ncbi:MULTISPECIES: NAD-binding protein [Dermacoccus]|uniref:Potassium transporter n=2 Tax=Dermacoccus TaxID=57495 RepID=A0A417Z5F6_9MICO|nr:NAD-binding protein [Dermacoccus abyssi]RHW45495.1 potassium transporter [Dermacoccus abyssi]
MSAMLAFFTRHSHRHRTRLRRPVRIPDEAPSTDAIFIVIRRMRSPLVFITTVFAISVLGLSIIPGKDANGNATHLSPFEAFYFISYTASTIGFGEIVPFTTAQRMWVTVCIFMTVVGWAYAIGTLLSLLQSASFQDAVAMQRFRRKVKRIREPFLIVCGYGQAGRQVCRELDEAGRRFVVIDSHDGRVERIATDELESDVPALEADASLPSVLGMAGLSNQYCEGVLALTDDDTDNLAIVMATTLLRPGTSVIARCMDRVVEERMDDFAPNAVINPSDRYGAYLVLALQRPATYNLVKWLMDPRDDAMPKPLQPKPGGCWVVCADGEFAEEVTSDLERAGMNVTVADPKDGHPDVSRANGFVVGTDNDTTNLALAEHAKIARSDLFVAVRQQSDARASLVSALAIDSVFTPTELVAQESLARVVTPLFWSFVEYAVQQPNEFAEGIIARLTAHCGHTGKERMLVDLSAQGSPALHRWLLHDELTVGQILKSSDGRDEHLPLVPLVLVRNGEHIFAPDESTTVTTDDHLLVVGHRSGLVALHETQYSDAAAEYIATGAHVPETWLWRKLKRHRPAA